MHKRTCYNCKVEKDIEEFYPIRRADPSRRQTYCAYCGRMFQKIRYRKKNGIEYYHLPRKLQQEWDEYIALIEENHEWHEVEPVKREKSVIELNFERLCAEINGE